MLERKQETGGGEESFEDGRKGSADVAIILTVNVDRACLFNCALHRHSTTHIAWAQSTGFHRERALLIDGAQQMLVQVRLNSRI